MKTKLAPIVVLAILCGCATTPTTGNVTQAVQAINAAVPAAVYVAATQEPSSIPYLKAAANVIADISISNNVSPTNLASAIALIPGDTQQAKAAVVLGIGIYESYFAGGVTNNADASRILAAMSSSIWRGLQLAGQQRTSSPTVVLTWKGGKIPADAGMVLGRAGATTNSQGGIVLTVDSHERAAAEDYGLATGAIVRRVR